MRKRFLSLFLVMALCFSMTVPTMALTWNTDKSSWPENTVLPSKDSWDKCIDIDGLKSIGYVDHEQSGMAATVCYCTDPARVTIKEYTSQVYANGVIDKIVSYADPLHLGNSVISVSVTDDGEIVKGSKLQPTWQNRVYDEEYDTVCNGVGTYWDLSKGIYYMGSVNASQMLYLVVGDPFTKDTPQVMFKDVPSNQYYYKPVSWAVQEGITNGSSATTFSPSQKCTQAHILTFLWRAAGKPEPTKNSSYTNSAVKESEYYYKALLWAWEKGLVVNKGLNPNAECQRSDVVTYLWKLEGKPETGTSTFADVPASADYAKAVAWAVDTGITKGTGALSFSPQITCDRGQIVTFLYRYFVGE